MATIGSKLRPDTAPPLQGMRKGSSSALRAPDLALCGPGHHAHQHLPWTQARATLARRPGPRQTHREAAEPRCFLTHGPEQAVPQGAQTTPPRHVPLGERTYPEARVYPLSSRTRM